MELAEAKGFLGSLSLWKRVTAVTAAAVVASNLLTLLFYSVFFADRLLLDLILTTVIVVLVAVPMSLAFFLQGMKVESLVSQLRQAAETDSLTGLSNRGGFMSDVNTAIRLAEAGSRSAGALLYVDLDRFKEVNDGYGHAAGDAVLRQVAMAFRSTCRFADMKARIGGEEFAVFLPLADGDEARGAAARLLAAVRNCKGPDGTPVTASIGSSVHAPGRTLDEIIDEADRNLYAAKQAGRDRAVHPGDPDVPLPTAA